MRKLVYVLANGTEVNTMAEAQASGQTYTTEMRTISEAKTTLSPIRKAMLEQFGYVSPKLKDKVVLQ